jgi:hypothetical protein
MKDNIITLNPYILQHCVDTDILKNPKDIFKIIDQNNLGIIIKIIENILLIVVVFIKQIFKFFIWSDI